MCSSKCCWSVAGDRRGTGQCDRRLFVLDVMVVRLHSGQAPRTEGPRLVDLANDVDSTSDAVDVGATELQ